jgi:excisionase family DNA binding protein
MNIPPGAVISLREALHYVRGDCHLDLKDAAGYVGLSERTLWKLLPEIPHFKVGRKLLFRRSELDRWLERYRERASVDDLDRIAVDALRAVGLK